MNGSLTRLLDADTVLRSKIVEFVSRDDFGLASGPKDDGGFERVWYEDLIPPDEVAFEAGVFLLTKQKAKKLKEGTAVKPGPEPPPEPGPPGPEPPVAPPPEGERQLRTLRLTGAIPPELWNRLGTKVLPKLRAGTELAVGIEFTVKIPEDSVDSLTTELMQILTDLGLGDRVRIE